MSRINDLIKEYCPNGVEVHNLGDLEDAGIVKLGRGNVISKTDLNDDPGDFPVYSSSALNDGLFGRYGKFMFEDERITWSIDGGGKFFYRPIHNYSVTNVCGWMKVLNDQKVSTKYLYYVLINLWSRRTYNYTVKAHPSVIRQDYFIPIPPLEVQREIVRVLDLFQELEAELEAELEVRKKQFEHYRNLFYSPTYAANSQFTTLGEIGSIYRGRRFVKDDIIDSGIPAIHYGELYTKYSAFASKTFSFLTPELASKLRFAKTGDVILVSAGETIEDIGKSVAWLGKEDVVIHDALYGFRSAMDPKYVSYYFSSSHFRQQLRRHITTSKVSAISPSRLAGIQIPIPSLAIQEDIAKILERFEEMITDLSTGLPAELNARRKQYEYYRDKLLTFEEAA